MKTIIVPVDFSDQSIQALRYAIQIANEFAGTITVVHSADSMAAASIYTDVRNMMKTVGQNKLDDLIKEEIHLLKKGAAIRRDLVSGNTVNGICEFATEKNADIIIMGTKGASGLKEIFIGSVAQGVMNAATCPVLVIPEHSKITPPAKIALALDDQELSSKKVVQPVKDLITAFKAKLEVFHYNKAFVTTDVDPRIDHYLNDVDFSFHEHYSDESDIVKVIDEFVLEEKVDILALIRRKRSFWDKMFHTSVTSQEVFHSKVPVLVLQEYK